MSTEVLIEYRNRKTFLIKVFPCKTVKLFAPKRASLNTIHDIIRKRAKWIEAKRNFYADCEQLSKPMQYIEGEEHLFLGKKLSLAIVAASYDTVEAIENRLVVYCKGKITRQKIKSQIESWYLEKAFFSFMDSMNLHSPLLKGLHNKFPILKQRYMRQQWGSCSSQGIITMNTHLVKTPQECIDFVMMHELCHLVVLNHGSKFYALLNRVMPDWKARQLKLKSYTCAKVA